MRLSPIASGTVRVDGVDVTKLHLHALRLRIGVIPQDPFIFTGSIRENVDPLHQYTIEEVKTALEACGAGAVLATLNAPATELSRGHAQMLCLARALLHRAKILIVDEATANVDHETERQILDTIRYSFGGSTVLFIAHRTAGVLECTRVMVMSGGKVVELRAPDEALADCDSHFYKLVCGEVH